MKLDAAKVRRRMHEFGWDDNDVVDHISLDERTTRRIIAGEQVQKAKAAKLAEALKTTVAALLVEQATNVHADRDSEHFGTFGEWNIVDVLSDHCKTSNGLEYEICRLERRLVPGSFGRGKHYNLRYLRTEDRAVIENRLARHPTVCDRLGRHPSFPENKAAECDGRDSFWVIDRWEDGRTLAEIIASGPLNKTVLCKTVREIAEALHALHEHKIIRRELTPAFIMLRDADLSVLLTDLELAKILEGSRTVSTEWKENPFLAPEVFRDKCDERSDVFSWAQILYYAATGKKPDKLPEPTAFLGVELPTAVKEIARRCVAPMPDSRPGSMKDVLKAIQDWK